MNENKKDTVIVRYSEIALKSTQVRLSMEATLIQNIEAMLKHHDVPGEIEREWGRIYIQTPEPEKAAQKAKNVPGISSLSPAIHTKPEITPIKNAVAETANQIYHQGSFAIRARRAGEPSAHPFTSKNLEEEGGAAVFNEVKDFEPRVDLDNPDQEIHIECRENDAYVFTEKISAPGGLPVGSQGGLVALISGGIDSPVAAWLSMKRGVDIYPVYFDLGKYGGEDHRERAISVTDTLQGYAPNKDLSLKMVPAEKAIDVLMDETTNTRMIHYRRFMYKASEIIAEKHGLNGVVTGEAIGQKSSQTPENLLSASTVTKIPVHRPLLGWDKEQITEKARSIGTYHDSSINVGCHRISPSKPVTRASVEQIRKTQPDSLMKLAEEAASQARAMEPGIPI